MVSWQTEPYDPKPLDVPFARKNIVSLRVGHPPFPLVPPGPPCRGQLFVRSSTGCESPQRVNKVDIVKEINNNVPGFSEINIQVPVQPAGQASQAARRSSAPIVSVGGVYIPIQ